MTKSIMSVKGCFAMKLKVGLATLILAGSAFSVPEGHVASGVEWRGDVVGGEAIIKQITACSEVIWDSVNVPSTYRGAPVTGIVDWAFRNNRCIKKVTIPATLRRMCADTFSGCDSLTNIEVETSHPTFCSIDGLVYSKDGKILKMCPCGRAGEVRVADGTECIGSDAFKGCSRLESVVLPESCAKIEYGVFSGCSNLTTVIMSANMTSIFVHVWDGCYRLRNLTLPGDLRPGNFSWYDVTNVKSIAISKGCTIIADRAFQHRANLKEVWIPDSVKVIGRSAFEGCVSLETVHMPSCLAAIGPSAFSGCGKFRDVAIPQGVELIADCAFAGCSNLTVKIPQGVTNISGTAFSGPRQRYGMCKIEGKDAEAQRWLDTEYKDIAKRSRVAFEKLLYERKRKLRADELQAQDQKMNELMRKYSIR